ncbi:MAG TPA: hypothetical protein DDZ88_13525 [Verrucomicrobiales bacterium]|nr:hypothetical protein [Verrucomicrobiales bacterium]
MPDASSSPRRFAVALSFPGEHREYVELVAKALLPAFGGEEGKARIFYDVWHESKVIGYNSNRKLQHIYAHDAELVVPFYCQDYLEKQWCGVELRAIESLLFEEQFERVLPFRFDMVDIPSSFKTDVFPIVNERPAAEIARLIVERYSELKQTALELPKLPDGLQIGELMRQQATSKIHICNLLIPRSEAERKLTERMAAGQSLLTSVTQLKDEVSRTTGFGSSRRPAEQQRQEELWSEYLIWTKFNDELLRRIFNSEAMALEYSAVREPEATWGVFLAEIEEFESGIKDDIRRIRLIKERLALFEEPQVGTTPVNESFAAPRAIQADISHIDAGSAITKESDRSTPSIEPTVELKPNLSPAPAKPKRAIESVSWIGLLALGAIFVCAGWVWWNDAHQESSKLDHPTSDSAAAPIEAAATKSPVKDIDPTAHPSDREPPPPPTPIIPETPPPPKQRPEVIAYVLDSEADTTRSLIVSALVTKTDGFKPSPVPLGLGWEAKLKDISKLKPPLLILHRDSLENLDGRSETDAQKELMKELVEFTEESPSTRFLVYSRAFAVLDPKSQKDNIAKILGSVARVDIKDAKDVPKLPQTYQTLFKKTETEGWPPRDIVDEKTGKPAKPGSIQNIVSHSFSQKLKHMMEQ